MQVKVLGATELVRAGAPVDLGSRKQRALLAALALHGGRPVAVDTLVDVLWEGEPPASVSGTLQVYVAGVRRALEPDRPARTTPTILVTVAPGYALRLADGALDAARFDTTVDSVHRHLGALSGPLPGLLSASFDSTARALVDIVERLNDVLASWRGTPYADLGDSFQVMAERTRLHELRLVAIEDRAAARLALGEHATVAAEMEAMIAEQPLRERLWVLRVLALAGGDRQADALEALRQVRHLLADELGMDPGSALRELETAVLHQDPALTARPPARGAAGRRLDIAVTAAAVVAEEGPAVAAVATSAAADDPRGWPLAGRRAELSALEDLLGAAAGGAPRFALLVGEPGIGKTRLTQELSDRARARGFAVLVGRCSQDEGAPPLWPWLGVLRTLAAAVPADELPAAVHTELAELSDRLVPLPAGGSGPAGAAAADRAPDLADAARFHTWDALGRTLVAASAVRPLLVVLDDLHWADRSSLRLLRHLTETLDAGRILTVATRRSTPQPDGAFAEAVEMLGRRHALRLDLTGLTAAEAAALIEAATGRHASGEEVDALRERTDGNPFFLVELLRLLAGRRIDDVVAGEDVPAAVTDVVARRLARLPATTQTVLRTAAVIGRQFDLTLLAAAAERDGEGVLDDLDAALAAGLISEERTVDRFRFAHALARDAVYAQLPSARRARRHAAVASALESSAGPGRQSETARHWLAAGPAHVARAWPMAAAAAAQARALYAHEAAAALLAAALDAQRDDASATPLDRYDLLVARADACRASADRAGLDAALAEAVREAELLGDVERADRAAVGTTEGVLWQVRTYGHIEHEVVNALRRVLRALPAEDSELRCRALLVLAAELYYAEAPMHREALAEQGLAMARRLGDPSLLVWACQTAFLAIKRAGTADRRMLLADEAVQASVRGGDPVWEAYARTLRATVYCETGRIAELRAEARRARALAERLRLGYALVVLGWLEVPWLAMQGRFAEAETLATRTFAATERTSVPQRHEGAAGAMMCLRLWQGRAEEVTAQIEAVDRVSPMPLTGVVRMLRVRAGQIDEALASYTRWGPLLGADDWFTLLELGTAAETAFALSLRDDAATVYEKLAPYAGQVCTAGSSGALGPVDAFLALAAGAAGDPVVAGRHADEALALCEKWEIPLVAEWLRVQRDRGGF